MGLYATDQRRGGLGLMQAFPSAFAFCCVLLFAAPMASLTQLHFNMNVRYWIGWWNVLAWTPLLVFAGAYSVHAATQRPNKAAVLASIVLPSALYVILGLVLWTSAKEKAEQLSSVDCSAADYKLALEHSWRDARNLFTSCMKATAAANPAMSPALGEMEYRIWQCQGYGVGNEANWKNWRYLGDVEERFGCAGWCTAERPMWTTRDTLDSCSAVVGQDLAAVSAVGRQVMCLSTLVFSFLGACLLVVGPRLRAKGYDW